MSAAPSASGAGGASNVTAGGSGGAPNVAGTAGSFGGMGPATAGNGAVGGSSSGGASGVGAAGAGLASSSGTGGTTAAGNGGGAGAAPLGALTLTGLKIDPNPNMTISCFVSWTTAEPASSEVDFGETSFTSRIRDTTLATDHRVLVIGMHAQKAYKLKAVSATATASGSVEGTFTTGMLPASLPTPTLTASDAANTQPGWTLTNIMPATSGPALAVMYDEKGLPVWYYVHGTHADSRGDVDTKLVGNSVLVGPTSGEPAREVDLSGKVLWEGPAQSNQELATHFFGKTSAGDYFLNIELDKAVQNGSTKIDNQRIEELSPTKTSVWSWTLFDHIMPAGNREELCHGNLIIDDPAAGFVYYNCRFLGLLKLERSSGNILWRLGGSYDTTSIGPGDFTFDPPASQFSDSHEPEFHDDGTLILYDNGGYSQSGGFGGNSQNYHSRVVEYQLDETKKTATRTWEFPGSFDVDAWYKTSWYSPFWGDADRLPNGNVLVTAPTKSSSASTRIFEVTRAGKVVWELTLPVNVGSFKADRLTPPPLVEAITP
jgi:hypothetical protein